MRTTRKSIKKEMKTKRQERLMKQVLTTMNASLALFGALQVVENTDDVSVTVEATNKQRRFIRAIGQSAREIGAKNDLYPSVMIAQAALESGWGQSELAQAPNHNLFGIKGKYNGQSVNRDTLEDDGSGNYYGIKDDFRKYPSYAESLQDYADVLTGDNNPNSWRYNYYRGAHRSQTNSYEDATAHLTGRYATDTRYGTKLNQLIETYDLTEYDYAPGQRPNVRTAQASSVVKEQANRQETSQALSQVDSSNATSTYTVQKGDGLYKIANQHGMNVNDLMKLNGITSLSHMIHPGQVLKVSGATSQSTAQIAKTEVKPAQTNTRTQASSSSNTSSSTNTIQATGTYTVQKGDGLYKIANQHGMNVNDLMKLNGITSLSHVIHPGQVLKVTKEDTGLSQVANTVTRPQTTNTQNTQSTQASTSSTRTVQASSNSNTSSNTQSQTTTGTYTVQKGDGLYKIAREHGMNVNDLMKLNGISSLSHVIHPGQVLKVSGATSTQETSSNDLSTRTQTVQAPVVETETTVEETVEETSQVDTQTEITTVEEKQEEVSTGNGTYTVKTGEGLWRIAQNHGMTLDEIVKLNGFSSANVVIHPGQVLVVK